jgi:hypothetical protein
LVTAQYSYVVPCLGGEWDDITRLLNQLAIVHYIASRGATHVHVVIQQIVTALLVYDVVKSENDVCS